MQTETDQHEDSINSFADVKNRLWNQKLADNSLTELRMEFKFPKEVVVLGMFAVVNKTIGWFSPKILSQNGMQSVIWIGQLLSVINLNSFSHKRSQIGVHWTVNFLLFLNRENYSLFPP